MARPSPLEPRNTQASEAAHHPRARGREFLHAGHAAAHAHRQRATAAKLGHVAAPPRTRDFPF